MTDFDTIGFAGAVIEDDDGEALPRQDYERYRVFLGHVPVGKRARFTVPTGDIIPDVKVDKHGEPVLDEETGRPVLNVNRGRGENELEAVRAFRTVANNELNLGIDIRHEHLPDGNTAIRLKLHPKKKFTAEQNASREAARQKGLLRRAEKRVATTQAALAREPKNPVKQAAFDKAIKSLEATKAKQNGASTPAPAKAAAKGSPATAPAKA